MTQELRLRVKSLTFRTLVQKDVVSEKNCHLIAEDVGDHFSFQLTRYFATYDARKFEVNIPTSWWQHFKQDCMPAWFMRLFPVKYDQRKFDVRALYRGLPVNRWDPFVVIEEEMK